MRWLDLSAYGTELKINTEALGKPALYVLNNGDAIDFALERAGFHRRQTGLWFRLFDFDEIGPILHSLVTDLPAVRVIPMSPGEIGFRRDPLHEEAPAEVHGQPTLPPVGHSLPEEPLTASTDDGVPVREDTLQADADKTQGQRGLLWKFPVLGLIGRAKSAGQKVFRHEPVFEEAPPHPFEAAWIVSAMPQDAREMSGRDDLPNRCHLLAKLRDPGDAAMLRNLTGERVVAESGPTGRTEVQLIAVVDGGKSGLGADGDVLVIGDPGDGFGAAILPEPVEAGRAA